MISHFSSILRGITQAIAVYAYLWIQMSLIDRFIDDWTMTRNMMIVILIVTVVVCSALVFAYPLYLFLKKRRVEAALIFVTTAICVSTPVFISWYLVNQISNID